MSETFGAIRARLSKLPHGAGVDPDVLDGYINDRYMAMISVHPWTRLSINAVLQVPAKYDTGTIAITAGATAVTLTGGTFTAAMTGRRIRIANRSEFYTFSFLTGSTGTIDRAYEGDTIADSAYRIWQAIFSLPSTVDFFQSVELPRLGRDLDQMSQDELDFVDPGRHASGGPFVFAPYQDNATTGVTQIELYPGTEIAEGLPIRYRQMVDRLEAPDDTGTEFPAWIDTQVIFAGVEADLYGLTGNGGMKQMKERDWAMGLQSMIASDIQRVVPSVMRMADRYVQHRADRTLGGSALVRSRLSRM